MTTDEHFDVAIIGNDVASYLCGALLALRKRRVCILQAPHQQFVNPQAPLFGLQTSPILRSVLDRIGLLHGLRSRLSGDPLPLHLALPDRRFEFPAQLEARGHMLASVFPHCEEPLLQLFHHVDFYGGTLLDPLLKVERAPEGFFSRRPWKKLLAALPFQPGELPIWTDHPQLQHLVRAILAIGGRNDDPLKPMTLSAARCFWHLCHGIAPVISGMSGFMQLLTERFASYGGKDFGADRAQACVLKRKTIAAIPLISGKTVTAKAFITSADDATLRSLWPDAPINLDWGYCETVRIYPSDRPYDLKDPCGYVNSAGFAGCVRIPSDSRITLCWRGQEQEKPDLADLCPLTALQNEGIEPCPFVSGEPMEPGGFYWRPISVPGLKNLFRIGEPVIPGLGLEGAALTAWQATNAADALCPKLSKNREMLQE